MQIYLGPHLEPLQRDDYKIESLYHDNIKIWLFLKVNDQFLDACFAGTNMRRLEEQFEWVLQRVRRFWGIANMESNNWKIFDVKQPPSS